MIFHSRRIHFNFLILLGVAIVFTRVDIMAHKCYVCGPKANISCDNFNPTNKAYIKDCPSAKGCSIQTHGETIERSCVDIRFHECQTANNIQYCYCVTDLCNGKETSQFFDDEDLAEEGSGTTTVIETNTINSILNRTNHTSQSSSLKVYFYSTYIPVLAFFCNLN